MSGFLRRDRGLSLTWSSNSAPHEDHLGFTIGIYQRWGFAVAPASVDYYYKYVGLVSNDPANPQPLAPAPCTAFKNLPAAGYDWEADIGVLFGEDFLENLAIQGEILLELGMGLIPGYDCVDAIVNGVSVRSWLVMWLRLLKAGTRL